ncbi:MAG TPA: hypothetical protein VNX68_10930 [Nitrosopumilaceae archaeon]|jgi:hypothetical protein|nr:hypothetical protein [Nitrosopumilaceae archaeon]
MKKLSAKKKIKLIKTWSKWFYEHSDTYEEGTLGADLAYLYAAICKDTYIEVSEKDCDLVKLLRQEGISEEDYKIWDYIHLVNFDEL